MDQTDKINNQFSIRVSSFNRAARWMQDPVLMNAILKMAPDISFNKEKKKCLDLCCGTGLVGKAFLEKGWEVSGIDLTEAMAQETDKFFPSISGNIEKMPFPNNHFDLCVLRQSFKLVNGPEALKEIFRVLKPSGSFILVQSIAFSDEDDPHYRLVQKARHINMIRYYSDEEFVSILKEHNFKIDNTKYVTVRESVDHWLESAPELSRELKTEIRNLISNAPSSYKKARDVRIEKDELFENWNWVLYRAIKQ